MEEKRKVDFLGWIIDVIIRPDSDKEKEGALGTYERDCDGCRIIFYTVPTTDVVVHECYHAFTGILSEIDANSYTFQELGSEIYAHSFHRLVLSVLNALESMKSYHKKPTK